MSKKRASVKKKLVENTLDRTFLRKSQDDLTCPVCNASVSLHSINQHLDECVQMAPKVENEIVCLDMDSDSSASSPVAKRTRLEATQIPLDTVYNNQSRSNIGSSSSGAAAAHANQRKGSKQNMPPPSKSLSVFDALMRTNATCSATLVKAPGAPDGLMLFENFISEDEEQKLVESIRAIAKSKRWEPSKFNGKHLGMHWGPETNFRDRTVRQGKSTKLPEFLDSVIARIKTMYASKLGGWIPNETNFILYQKANGCWLKQHFDDRALSGEFIANVSLLGNCKMKFVHGKDKSKVRRVLLPRRSMSVMSREARYYWTHGIDNEDLLDDERISINLRMVR